MNRVSTSTAEPEESINGDRTWRAGVGEGDDGDTLAVRDLTLGFSEKLAVAHDTERALVVLSGTLTLRTSSGDRSVPARSVVFVPAGVSCWLEVDAPTRVLSVASAGAQADPGSRYAGSDAVVVSIDDSEGVVTTDAAMGLFEVGTRSLVSSDNVGSRTVLVGHSQFASDKGSHELHRHDRPEFLYVISGAVHALGVDDETMLTAGDLVYIRPGEWHGLRAINGGERSEHIFGYLGAASFLDAGYAVRD